MSRTGRPRKIIEVYDEETIRIGLTAMVSYARDRGGIKYTFPCSELLNLKGIDSNLINDAVNQGYFHNTGGNMVVTEQGLRWLEQDNRLVLGQ